MKATFLMLVLSSFVYSQDIQWEKSFGGRHAEFLFDAQATADYGFVIGGSSLSNNSGNYKEESYGDLDYVIWKLNENGEVEWQKTFGGIGADLLKSIRVTSDGGFILAGTSNSPISGSKTSDFFGENDFWVVKLDARGNEQWQKSFGGSGQDDLFSINITQDGGYIIGGSSDSDKGEGNILSINEKNENSRGNMDFWVIKISSIGTVDWQKTFGGEYSDILRTAIPTSDKGYLLGGHSNSGVSGDKTLENLGVGADFWIIKLDESGLINWQKSYGGDGDDQLYDVIQIRNGAYVAAGTTNSSRTPSGSSVKDSDFLLVNFDINGSHNWSEAYDFGKSDVLISVLEDEDENLILGGYSSGKGELNVRSNEYTNDYLLVKTSNKGNLLWTKNIGSKGEDILRKTIITRDNGYLLCGTSNTEFTGGAKHSKSNLRNSIQDDINAENLISEANLSNLLQDKSLENLNSNLDDFKDDMRKVGITSNIKLPSLNEQNSTGMNNLKGHKKELSFSRDKSLSYGKNDFWIIKIKDNLKIPKEKVAIEAIPNPAISFTNIIIGYEYEKGTASLYNINGAQLQQFVISSRTIPIDMTQYSPGIYIVTIRTEKGENSVKIIKGFNL